MANNDELDKREQALNERERQVNVREWILDAMKANRITTEVSDAIKERMSNQLREKMYEAERHQDLMDKLSRQIYQERNDSIEGEED